MKLYIASITILMSIFFQMVNCTPKSKEESSEVPKKLEIVSKPELLKKQITVFADAKKRSIGFYEYHPADYRVGKHPVIIYLHGIGERSLNLTKTGTDTSTVSLIAKQPIPKYLAKATMKFKYGTKDYSFIVLAPQLSSEFGNWRNWYTSEMLNYIKKDTNADLSRIYLTGMSLGGGGVWNSMEIDSIAKQIAAIGVVCGTCSMDNNKAIVKYNIPVWMFHAKNDGVVSYLCTEKALAYLRSGSDTLPLRRSLYVDGGHGIWPRAYDTAHSAYLQANGKVFLQNPNLYEWFLRYKRKTY